MLGIRLICCNALAILKRKSTFKSNAFLTKVYTFSGPTKILFLVRSVAFFFLLVFLTPRSSAFSDYSISFEEFKKKLEGVFTEELFNDLRTHLPEQFEIWGYDVGDFSGDDEADLAISVKPKEQSGKNVQVFFFVNDGSDFIEASTLYVRYFEIPIEVGFTIEHGICYMTSKEKEHHWFITGYTYHSGSFVLVDRFEVGRQSLGADSTAEIGHEIYDNYQTLASKESFFNVSNGKLFLGAQYYTFPAYRNRRKPLPDYVTTLHDTSGKYFISGKENWRGPKDLSFSANLAYDDSSLDCLINVIDDSLAVGGSEVTEGDCVSLWFDLKANRINPSSGAAPNFRLQPDSNVMLMSISPGDYRAKRPRLDLILRKDPTDQQQHAIKSISVLSTKRPDGYSLRVRIPFSLFGDSKPPGVLGFTLDVNDVDRNNGGASKTRLGTSQLRDWDPSTFGILRFIPERGTYGEVRNLFIETLLKRIRDIGI
jgi:hypothetical protein